MQSIQIIDHIKALSLLEKLNLIELIFQEIREDTLKSNFEEKQREKAVELLLDDYRSDKELTAFTSLDNEAFYET